MNNHATSKRIPSSPRTCRGEVDWTVLGIVSVTLGAMLSIGLLASKVPIGSGMDRPWEVQTLPVKDDEVMCYILTTPKGAVDLECLPYHYEVEETQDEYETRA